MATVAQVVSQETGEDKDETGWLCVIPSATAGTYTITVTASNTQTDYAFAFYEFPIGTYTYDVGSATTILNTETLTLPSGDDYYIYAYSAGNGLVTATTVPHLDADSEFMGGASVGHDTAETETFSATGDLVMCGIGIKRTDAAFVAPTPVGQTAQGVISTTFTFTVANTGSFVVLGLAVGYWEAVSVTCPFPTCTRMGQGTPEGLPFQGEYAFYANGLYWAFYTDGIGNDVGWTYSKDTTIWSAYNLLSPTSYQFALTVVGGKVYYARVDSVSGRCYFNYGPMGIDGSITWTGEVDIGAPLWLNYPSVAIDDSGNVYIAITNSSNTIYVYTNRTGPWTQDFARIGGGNLFQRILALTSGKMVLVYNLNYSDNLHTERFNGAVWSGGSSTSSVYYLMYSGFVAIGDVVYGATAAYGTYNATYDYATDTWTETAALDTQVTNIASNSSNRLVMSYWGVNTIDYTNSTDLGLTWSPLASVDTVTNPVWVTPILTDTNNLSFVFRSTFANPAGYWVNNPPIIFPATTNLPIGTDLTLAIISASGVIAPVSTGTDTTLTITSASGVITPISTGMDFTLTTSASGAVTPVSAGMDTTLAITSASGVVAPISTGMDTTLAITSASDVIAQPMPVGIGFALTATIPTNLSAEATATTTVTTQDISKPLTAGIGATTTVTTQDITNSLAAETDFTLTTAGSGVVSSESAGIGFTLLTLPMTHVSAGMNFTLTASPIILITPPTDFGVGWEEISIQRIYPTMPPSGAYPMTPLEEDYLATTYEQMIDTIGMSITYKIAKVTGQDQYEHPIYTYTDLTINAVVSNMTEKEYDYVEVGFLPAHYSKLWVYQVTPEVGDRLLWMDILWEVRAGIPRVIGNTVLYYDIIIRRVLSEGAIVSGGTLTTGGEGTLTTGGGGTSNPPDPNDP